MDSPAISLSSSLYTTIKSVTHENHSAKLDDQENKKLENFCSKILSNKSRLQSVSIETFDESNWPKKHRHILTVILNNRLYRIPLDNIEYTTRKNFHVAKLNLTFVNVNNDGDHNQPHKSCNPKWYNVTDFMLDADQMPSDGIHRLQLLNIFHYNGKRYQHYFFHPNSSSNDDESKSVLLINGKIHSISNKPGYFPFFDNDYIYHSIDHDGFNGGRNKWKSLGYFLFKSRDKQSGQNITRIQSIYLNKNYDPMIPYAMYNWTQIEQASVIMIRQLNGHKPMTEKRFNEKIFDDHLPFGFIDNNRMLHLWLPWRHSVVFIPYLSHLDDLIRLPMAEISMHEYFHNCPQNKHDYLMPYESKKKGIYIRFMPSIILVISLLMILILCGGKGKNKGNKKKNNNKSPVQIEPIESVPESNVTETNETEQLIEQQQQQQIETDVGVGSEAENKPVTEAENIVENEVNQEQQQALDVQQQQEQKQPVEYDEKDIEIKMKMMENRMKMGKEFDFGKAAKHFAKILVGKKSQIKRIGSGKSNRPDLYNNDQMMFSDYDEQKQQHDSKLIKFQSPSKKKKTLNRKSISAKMIMKKKRKSMPKGGGISANMRSDSIISAYSDRAHTSKLFGSPVSKLRPGYKDTTRRSFLEWFLPPQRSRRHIPSPRTSPKLSSYRNIPKPKQKKQNLSALSTKIHDSTSSLSSIISRSTYLHTTRNATTKKSPMRRSSHKLHLGFSGFEVGVVPKKPYKRLHQSSDMESVE
ncbi:hypothetical protein HUG17_1601 [Dermatophagoides farinae]|uniref:Uncharacterized protein n=1 Tax=Dermatophagoides farinae TaxID=6954 RepID=A0A9D4P8Z4_DERFA|nr:hypothetical protein HUG17_1601 [Dermatophagoides farinae]